jgi:hypothetical protein
MRCVLLLCSILIMWIINVLLPFFYLVLTHTDTHTYTHLRVCREYFQQFTHASLVNTILITLIVCKHNKMRSF